ncbi:MAG: hypothetical protein WCI53_13735 [Bacteroidota bacterium]|jgi:hypothetical protein
METILIQLNNNKAYQLLKDLEELNIIKLLRQPLEDEQTRSKKYSGKLNLSDNEFNAFQNHISESRNEWECKNI